MKAILDTTNYYRLPWTLNDNILGWLEPTKRCNLYCEGCYSRNEKQYDKSLADIRNDLDIFTKNRRMDSISITGGDPLVHPEIVEIVRIIREEYHLKPVLNTNGLALTPELLRELKRAGVFGFTFHIDSSQARPRWKGKNELELNELRLSYAQMVAEVDGLSTSFNSTVFPHTLAYVPEMIAWARQHVDIVHNMVFILFRTSRTSEFDYFAKGERVDSKALIYYDEDKCPRPLTAPDVVRAIRERDPDFEACAYLGGTKDPKSFKWLVAGRVASKEQVYGYVGKRFMELTQVGHHMLAGRYLAYSEPSTMRHGRGMLLGLSPIDGGLRRAAARYARSLIKAPWRLASRLYFQSIVVIQPIDMMADGEINMCDGCPDMTVHDGELVWSCRLDERLRYGCFLTTAPKGATAQAEATAAEIERRRLSA